MALKIGDTAPDFSLPDENEDLVNLSDHRGKWLVLYFYPKDNTPGCTLEAKAFTKDLPNFKKINAEVLGVSADNAKSHCTFIEKNDLKVTLLTDKDHTVLEKYDTWHQKSMYGKLFWGIQRSTYLIDPKGKIAYIWPKVSVKGHSQEVLTKLKELS